MKLADHVTRYLALALRADRLFETVVASHRRFMPCAPGCDDCCAVYFQVSLIEAFYINRMFRETLTPDDQAKALAAARESAPRFEEGRRLVRDAGSPLGRDDPVDVASRLKIPCPLLVGKRCLLYGRRPITCRVYGIPELLEGGRVVACPRTAFKPGASYPTAHIGEIQRALISHSRDFLTDLVGEEGADSFPLLFTMHEVLLTSFDGTYFLSPKG